MIHEMDAFLEKFLQQFQHLKIQLEEITLATNNFNADTNCIGVGGFGKVYKGELSHSEGRSMVAIKRLDPKHGQGIPEFLKEITTLSRYYHENLISLLGYCYQSDEMILVYEHASRGSLDHHLNSPNLTWSQRLKICLDVAKGLRYLHDPRGTHQRLIHCDIKSANILLDDHWNAKVSDFGLSIMGPANEKQSVIVTLAVGTHGYYDPEYAMTHTLTKESDVYSFGVVLFEVLCGTLCCTYSNGCVQQVLVPTWIESYKEKKLNDIIFKSPTIQPMDPTCFETFSDIAYRCLKESREDRPKMAEVVTRLESAFEHQDFSEGKVSRFFYQKIAKIAEPPLNYTSRAELKKLLSRGIFLNGGKTWFSLNKKGEHCEMISFVECLNFHPLKFKSRYDSRFDVGPYRYKNGSVKARAKTQILSPLITYAVNLVFNFVVPKKGTQPHEFIFLKYKLQGEKQSSISYIAYEREDRWWMCELYHFTTDQRIVDLEILFDGFECSYDVIEVDGIEFWPLEEMENKDDKQPISDSDADWEEKLPTDYEDIMKWSIDSVQWTTKKEVSSVIRKGFLIDDGKWFYLDINGKKCHMLSVREAGIWVRQEDMVSLPESRFGEAAKLTLWSLRIDSKIQSRLVSPQTTYGCYLVYKLPKDQSGFEVPMVVMDGKDFGNNYWYIYLASPQIPVIKPKAGQNTHNPLNRGEIIGLPRQRSDGWMEVQIWVFRTSLISKTIPIHLALTNCGGKMYSGLIIQGIEFRPI